MVAANVIAAENLPPFDNSAVDGFAVRHADLAPGDDTRLAIVDRALAGHEAAHGLGAGQAIRIFTGAPMPPGADTVFMQEDCRVEADAVVVPAGLERGANSRCTGEDIGAGAVMLPAGRRLTAQDLALAAAQGMTRLAVRRKLRVAVFSTGDEVVEPGDARPAAAIFDANRHLLRGLLETFGAVVTDLGILPDERPALQRAIAAAAADHDLVITSGGVSTGEADHVRAAVEAIGRLVFWRVAIKPGRPVAMGVLPGKHGAAAFAGLPGNPAAVYVTFVRVVWPLLLRLAGAAPRALFGAPGARHLRLSQAPGTSRICPRHAAKRRRRRGRGGEISPRRRRRDHFADRDRWPGRARRGRHRSRAGRDGGVPVLRGADGVNLTPARAGRVVPPRRRLPAY